MRFQANLSLNIPPVLSDHSIHSGKACCTCVRALNTLCNLPFKTRFGGAKVTTAKATRYELADRQKFPAPRLNTEETLPLPMKVLGGLIYKIKQLT